MAVVVILCIFIRIENNSCLIILAVREARQVLKIIILRDVSTSLFLSAKIVKNVIIFIRN